MIGDIQKGKLTARMDLDGLPEGLCRYTDEGVNMIIEAVEKPLEAMKSYLEEVAKGDTPPKITDTYKGDFNAIKEALNSTGDIITRLLSRQSALDNVSTGVMLVDNERNITYANRAVQKLLKEAEADIRKQLPSFNADRLTGVNIDHFHRSPAHQSQLLARLTSSHVARLAVGGRALQVIASPVFDAKGNRLGSVAEWVDLTDTLALREKEQRLAVENTRIRMALDNVTTNVMIADNEHNIIYMNKSASHMLARAEADLRKVLPNFNTSRLIEANMDQFHKQPTHQRDLLAGLVTPHRAQIEVGTRTFALIANPVIDEKNNRLGSVVEWKDRTDEVNVEQEIAAIVNAAGRGDFGQRIDVSTKQGFFRNLGEGMNALMETSQKGLSEIARVLSALSRGDLTETITNEYQGMFGQLKDDSNTTVGSLSKMVLNIKTAVDAINTAAGEIAAGTADLSHRTETQAASLEETASSMEQLASAVKQNAGNAQKASHMAIAASDVAVKGGSVVQHVACTMNAINDCSRKIIDIISVIDGIAGQTNILALNAAVEAARAGDQGRGFAVVAAEVRNLAHRSAGAAKEVKELIGDSVDKVEVGTKLVGEAGKTMNEIVASIQSVTEIMSEIAMASAEQSSGIAQVNLAVTQMDEATQQNAALVEEASAAAESLKEQANRLTETMQQFHLDTSTKFMAETQSPALRRTPAHKPVQHLSSSSISPRKKALPLESVNPGSHNDDEWEEF